MRIGPGQTAFKLILYGTARNANDLVQPMTPDFEAAQGAPAASPPILAAAGAKKMMRPERCFMIRNASRPTVSRPCRHKIFQTRLERAAKASPSLPRIVSVFPRKCATYKPKKKIMQLAVKFMHVRDSRIRRTRPTHQRLRRETDLTISIFSSVIGKHMFVDSPNA